MATQALPTRRDLQVRLTEKAWKDPEFKAEVLRNPKGMFENYLGQKLPEGLKIIVHEEDANTLHFSIPLAPSNVTELSDADLERVAGGTDIAIVTMIASAVATLGIGGVAGAMATLTADTANSGW